MHTREQKLEAFGRLFDVLDNLRHKCPWDKNRQMRVYGPIPSKKLMNFVMPC